MFYKKLPSGKYRYYEKYYNDNEGKWKQVSVTLNSKSRQAQAHAKELLAEKIEAAQDTLFGLSEHITVSELLPEWLSIRQQELKESTYASQLNIINVFQNHFGGYQLRKINSSLLQRYLLSRQDWSKGYRALNKTILSLFFEYCIRVGCLTTNPMKQVVLPKQKTSLEQIRQRREKFLSYDEMKDYLAYLNQYGKNVTLNLLIELMYLTGLRSGEALGLTWDVIDFENKTIEVKQTLQTRGRQEAFYLSSPKTLSGYRVVLINDRCINILKTLKEKSSSLFVFTTKKETPIRLSTLNYYLARTFQEANLTKSQLFKMTSHVLRHSHISLLVEKNVPLRTIMDRVGHSDEKTTVAVYTHVTAGMISTLGQTLEKIDFS